MASVSATWGRLIRPATRPAGKARSGRASGVGAHLGDENSDAFRRRLTAISGDIRAKALAARQDRALLQRLDKIRAQAEDWKQSQTALAYAEAFRGVGLDLSALDPAEVARRLRSRPP